MVKQPNPEDLPKSQGADDEFQEIAHPGVLIEFVRENGQVTGIKRSGKDGGVGMFQLQASPNGQVRNIVHSQGFMPNGLPPDPLIPVWMISDKEGLFGRTCPDPKCKSYFRSDWVTEDTACPYCGHWDNCLAFTTLNQQEFITQQFSIRKFDLAKACTIKDLKNGSRMGEPLSPLDSLRIENCCS